ncbi:MAG: hypothetical protein D5S00_10660 [Tindallia sp. MSAO_Bac2]|nr:MAG: hypothetical protein D5S00_10660 [Tindallia sp. MSAO_Bac2]
MLFRKKLDIELNEELIKKNKVPLLIKDPLWKSMVANIKDRKINNISQELSRLIKEEKTIEVEISRIKKTKNDITNRILEMSHKLNEKNQDQAGLEMQKARQELREATNQLNALYEKKEELPAAIREVNFELLNATVDRASACLIREDNRNQKVEEEISQLREKLNTLREKKEEAEVKMQLYYQFLHSLLGPEQMEKLDRQLNYKYEE